MGGKYKKANIHRYCSSRRPFYHHSYPEYSDRHPEPFFQEGRDASDNLD
jgi:hypothetical protein